MTRTTLLLSSYLFVAAQGRAAETHGAHGAPTATPAAPRAAAQVRGPDAASSITPTAAFDARGTLWVVFVEGPQVYVTASEDLGKTFRAAVPVNREAEVVDANGEARPKIAVGAKGEIYVSYTHKLEKPFTGDVRFSRSTDGGRTFSAPVTVNDDRLVTGHRFDALSVSPKGDVHLFWIDKRDLERAATQKKAYAGAAVYTAVSTDAGATFAANRKLKDHVCECCRLAVAWKGDEPLLFWRDLMDGGVRDHSLALLDKKEEAVVRRVTEDGWQIPGCPHHGPAFAISGDGALHLAWFTGDGALGKGTFYRRLEAPGSKLAPPVRLGEGTTGRPQVVASGRDVVLSWRQAIDEQVSAVFAVRSSDGGGSWSKPREIARTRGENDHPLLITHEGQVYLSWFSRGDGYRLIPVDGEPSSAPSASSTASPAP